MTTYNRFKRRNSIVAADAQKEVNRQFILNGYPSVKIENYLDSATTHQAVVVNKQEQNLAYIYTNEQEPLNIGSVWKAKTLNLMVYQEIVTIKDVAWHKYKAFLCNTEVAGMPGYLIGPETSKINVDLAQKAVLISQATPLLVLPANCGLTIGSRIYIKSRGWEIQEYDNYSTTGIIYFTLTASTVSKDALEKAQETGQDSFTEAKTSSATTLSEKYNHNQKFNIKLNNLAYDDLTFKAKPAQIVTERNGSTVTCLVPFGIDTVTFY